VYFDLVRWPRLFAAHDWAYLRTRRAFAVKVEILFVNYRLLLLVTALLGSGIAASFSIFCGFCFFSSARGLLGLGAV
jgi:hypothetical protein